MEGSRRLFIFIFVCICFIIQNVATEFPSALGGNQSTSIVAAEHHQNLPTNTAAPRIRRIKPKAVPTTGALFRFGRESRAPPAQPSANVLAKRRESAQKGGRGTYRLCYVVAAMSMHVDIRTSPSILPTCRPARRPLSAPFMTPVGGPGFAMPRKYPSSASQPTTREVLPLSHVSGPCFCSPCGWS